MNDSAYLFAPLSLRGVQLRNRIAVSPMCQYSCENLDGIAHDWHLVHLGARASGGTGLVLTEAASVAPEGRISPEDLGIWSDAHAEALKAVTAFIRSQGAASGIQLAHAGRKAGTYRPWSTVRGHARVEDGGWSDQVAPSAIAFREGMLTPAELDTTGIGRLQQAFVSAARRSVEAGFDVIELHAAHGYLLHQFLSPISNRREDRYGGDFTNRARFITEIVQRVRKVIPDSMPLLIRVSATDWIDDGWTLDESVELAVKLKAEGVDLFDCSSGGSTMDAPIPLGPGYQVPLAAGIRHGAGMPTGAVGQIVNPHQADQIVRLGQADLVLLGREMLRDPYWPCHAAVELGHPAPWPIQYGWVVSQDTPERAGHAVQREAARAIGNSRLHGQT